MNMHLDCFSLYNVNDIVATKTTTHLSVSTLYTRKLKLSRDHKRYFYFILVINIWFSRNIKHDAVLEIYIQTYVLSKT